MARGLPTSPDKPHDDWDYISFEDFERDAELEPESEEPTVRNEYEERRNARIRQNGALIAKLFAGDEGVLGGGEAGRKQGTKRKGTEGERRAQLEPRPQRRTRPVRDARSS